MGALTLLDWLSGRAAMKKKKYKTHFVECGEEYEAYCTPFRWYCSTPCQVEARHKRFVLSDYKTDGSRRRFLIRKHGHCCMLCHSSTWNGQPITLELDHISGDSTNNREDNLRIVCPNCHAQTPTYKNKNKGHGRKHRHKSIDGDARDL